MSYLVLDRLTKTYGDTNVVDALTLAVEKGEFVSLLGPSGCGKTTTLQMIAGFVEPTSGGVTLDGRDLLAVPPAKRGLGIVFQSYALFPHMNAAQNVAFGLEMRGVPARERDRLVDEALALVGLAGLGDRHPMRLSGGQQQRVALARALVVKPSILLLDEPLSNLDAKLREEMQIELRDIQRTIGTTTILVTHDQAEAMALADRIAVMDKGRVLQFATPSQLYRQPADPVVARFIGDGMVLPVDVVAVNADASCQVDLYGYRLGMRCAPARTPLGAALACVRAASLQVMAAGGHGLRVRATGVICQGGHFRVEGAAVADADVALHFTVTEPCAVAPGAALDVSIDDGWVIPAREA